MSSVRRRLVSIGIALLAPLLGASTSGALPFRNGGFEEATLYPDPDGTYRFGSMFVLPPSPLVGWVFAGGGDLEYIGADYWQHAEGNHSLELNGLSAGSISQLFDTTPGATYRVTFAMSGHPGEDGLGAPNTVGRPLSKNVYVAVDNHFFEFSFGTVGITFDEMGWVEHSFEFVAADFYGGMSQLLFASMDQILDPRSSIPACRTLGGCYGPVIDNVRVALVPEPSLLGGVALAALSALRTRAGSARCARTSRRGRASRA